jgi:hypothetical protein
MSDLNHYIGGDLSLTATGDLAMATDSLEGQQRVLRRLLTNPGDYIWHPTYGAGLPGEIGKTLDVRRVKGIVRSQIFNEAIVSRSPDPNIIINAFYGGISARIQYNDNLTKKPVSLSFDINK